MKRFLIALQFLTVWPFGNSGEVSTEDLVGSTAYYPVVGMLIGFVLYIFWLWTTALWPALLAAVLTVALWELLSAGLHLDGLMDTFDGLGVRGNLEKRLTVMKDSRVGAFGAQAAVFSMLLKVASVASLGDHVTAAMLLILAPLTGRTVMVVFMGSANYARADEGLGKIFVERTGKRQLVLAVILYLIFGIAVAGPQIILIAPAAAVVFLILRFFFLHNFKGVTGDILGAACELLEIAVLLLTPFLL